MPIKSLDPAIATRVQSWLDGPYDPETKTEIRRLLKENPQALSDAFYRDLSFGTGGMRGILGVGTNRMNVYTVQMATQGLVNYLRKQQSDHAVFIGYDVRHLSKEFAEEAARVLAGNGIRALLAKEICPTPLVSFGCRYYECSAAIMITASHNPPQYNGFKVYWSDGAQVVPPHDTGIIEEVKQIRSIEDVTLAEPNSSLIHHVGEEFEQIYLKELKKLQLFPGLDSIDIIYTNLHGTGIRLAPQALRDWGYSQVSLVEKQASPDPNFTFAPKPNPEELQALQLGIDQMLANKADLLLATDPDADRVGVVIREKDRAIPLTGNQTACICLHHICEALAQKGTFPPNAAFVKTIVTTELFRKIAESYGGTCIDVLTGFKYIAEKIHEWETSFGGYQYVFGAEESYGCLFDTFVRDKDAISACCLIAEAAALAKKQNLNLHDHLYKLYRKYGIHREKLLNVAFSDSSAGMQQMQTLMQHLRENPPFEINRIRVLSIEDYLERHITDLQTGERTSLELPRSDVLLFRLEDQSKLVIRPSGTEPKIKIYGEVVEENAPDLEAAVARCESRLEQLLTVFQKATLGQK